MKRNTCSVCIHQVLASYTRGGEVRWELRMIKNVITLLGLSIMFTRHQLVNYCQVILIILASLNKPDVVMSFKSSNGSVMVVHSKVERMKEIVRDVEVLSGEDSVLPCTMSVFNPKEDRPKLILWFKNDSETPFYIYDAVEAGQPRQWRDGEESASVRSKFDGSSNLIISHTRPTDAGSYRCRVDYLRGQTTFDTNLLSVITLPSPPTLLLDDRLEVGDESDKWIQVTENSSLTLECRSRGGMPRPKITWWLDNVLLDDSYDSLDDDGDDDDGELSRSRLHLASVNRTFLNKVITCEVTNTRLSPPLHASLQLDMILSPSSVTINTMDRPVTMGDSAELECVVTGARPEPGIVWRGPDIVERKRTKYKVHEESEATSQVMIRPGAKTPVYNYQCIVVTPNLNTTRHHPLYNITTNKTISVHYIPDVTIQLGASLNKSYIKENSDVYFECL